MTMMASIESNPVQLAAQLKALADELRLAILQVLATDSYGVLELAQIFDCKQSGMSHHLKVLANANLVSSRREGNSIFYRRSVVAPKDPFSQLKLALYKQIDALPLAPDLQNSLEVIWQTRAKTSQRFFSVNADKFHAQQDLIASFETYQPHLMEMLKICPTPSRTYALEIGPGNGEFLLILGQFYQNVLAIDNSQTMLTSAKEFTRKHNLGNVSLQLGDTDELSSHRDKFALAVSNMVLHHTPSPSRIFHHVASSLCNNGVFLVTELCSHQQAWAQEACGDIWLGFAPEDLIGWADEAGLKHGQCAYYALRNGFQIQIHQFIKSLN